MGISHSIDQDIKEAMLAKNAVALAALRAVKSAFMLAKTDGSGKKLTEADELAILNKIVKQRKDSIQLYIEQNRVDLADEEKAQLEVIMKYMPAQLSEAEVEVLIRETIASIGASGMKDMGKVMGAMQTKIAGKADGRVVSELVKKLLGN